MGHPPCRNDSETPSIERFQGDGKGLSVFILSLKVGGTGFPAPSSQLAQSLLELEDRCKGPFFAHLHRFQQPALCQIQQVGPGGLIRNAMASTV